MVIEALAIGGYCLTWKYWDEYHIRKKFRQIMNGVNLYNNLGKTIKVWKYEPTEYGYDLTIELPYGVTVEKIKKNIDVFKEGMQLYDINLKPKNNMCIMNCIKDITYKAYEHIPLPPNMIYITQGLHDPIIVDMNELPGVLIAGSPSSGKTRALLVIMTNLICSSKHLEIFLIQSMKQDLKIFEDCEQVKAMATELDDIKKLLIEVYNDAKTRSELIDTKQGYYNIEDYNKAHNPSERLKYRYVVIEEFSFLNTSKGDNNKVKAKKQECLQYIEGIAKAGRSSGVFIICCLQRPTDDSINSQTKNLLNTCIAFRLKSEQESRVIITAPDAVNLEKREMMIRTDKLIKANSLTIDHETVMKYIKNSIVEKPKVQKLKIPNNEREDFFELNTKRH